MRGKSHKIIGIATVMTVAATSLPSLAFAGLTLYPMFGLPLATVSAKLADIDLKQSEYGSKHKYISKLLSHRGFTHTGILIGFMYTIMQSLTHVEVSIFANIIESIVFGFIVGYASHLIADMHNKKGIPLLWPIILKKLYLMCILTDDYESAKKPVTPEKTFTMCYCIICFLQVLCYWFNITV